MSQFSSRFIRAALVAFLLAISSLHYSSALRAEVADVPEPETTQPDTPGTDDKKTSTNDITGWNIELERMLKALAREGIQDSDFDQINKDASNISDLANGLVKQLAPDLAILRERYNRLGPVPPEGQPAESNLIAIKRAELAKQVANVDGNVKAAQLVIVKSRQIRDGIIETRRARFVRAVTSRSYVLFDANLWQPFWEDLTFFGRGLPLLLSNVVKSISLNLQKSETQTLFVTVSVFVWLLTIYLVLRGLRRFNQRIDLVETDRSRLALSALVGVLINGFVPGALLLGLIWIADSFRLLSPIYQPLVMATSIAIAIAVTTAALARAFVQPAEEWRRIAVLSNNAARKIMGAIFVAITVFVISWIIYDAGRAMVATLQFGIAVKSLFALSIAALTAITLRMIQADRHNTIDQSPNMGLNILLNWNVLKAITWTGVVVVVIALLAGYIALADFAANQIIVTSTVLATLWLLLRIVDDNIVGCFQSGHEFNSSISNLFGWRQKFAEQIGVVFTGLLRLTFILLTILVLLIPWGYRATDWVDWISAAFFGFKVGDITISISVILSAIVVFAIGVLVTRSMQRWLSNKFLPTTRLDIGIRNSITTIFNYTGITIAAMIAISFAGFDLSNLAIVAGALSLGIGFGLQSVVSNFVSGLILLAERPIKAGDWVVTSGGEGTVRKISVRSTKIETFDRSTVVVPNSTLITDSVVNWNHKSSLGRIKIPIGVGYESDPVRVRELLFECASAHDGILDNPEPQVYFMEFGASSLDFELRCFLADVGYGLSVKSDLRFAIFEALAKDGISIPFPQQDVHIKGFQQNTETDNRVDHGSSAAKKAPSTPVIDDI